MATEPKFPVKVSSLIEIAEKQRAQWLAEVAKYNRETARIDKQWKAWENKVVALVKSGKLSVKHIALYGDGNADMRVDGKLPASPKVTRRTWIDVHDDHYYHSNKSNIVWARRLSDFDGKITFLKSLKSTTVAMSLNSEKWGHFFQ